MTDTPSAPSAPEDPAASRWLAVLAAWWVLTALGQLLYVAQWPMYLLGTEVPRAAAVLAGLARLGIYGGLAWGVLQRDRSAWAGSVLELARTFLVFELLYGRELAAGIYPAAWAQAALAGALPLLLPVHLALALGWRPGPALDFDTHLAARMLAASCVIAALWLRRRHEEFGVPRKECWKVLFREGLPFVLALSLIDALAVGARLAGWI